MVQNHRFGASCVSIAMELPDSGSLTYPGQSISQSGWSRNCLPPARRPTAGCRRVEMQVDAVNICACHPGSDHRSSTSSYTKDDIRFSRNRQVSKMGRGKSRLMGTAKANKSGSKCSGRAPDLAQRDRVTSCPQL